jgi:hypothetical protein
MPPCNEKEIIFHLKEEKQALAFQKYLFECKFFDLITFVFNLMGKIEDYH